MAPVVVTGGVPMEEVRTAAKARRASDAAADWAQKRRQALERATELRAQRKAAERAGAVGAAAPVRGLENEPLPTHHAQDVDADAPWWESSEGAAPFKPSAAAAAAAAEGGAGGGGGGRQRRQWGDAAPPPPHSAAARPSSHGARGGPSPSTPSPESESRGQGGGLYRAGGDDDDGDDDVVVGSGGGAGGGGGGGGRLLPWEEELLVKQAEEEYAAMGREPPPPEVLLARVAGGDASRSPHGADGRGGDPDVWGPPLPKPPKPAKVVTAKRKPASASVAARAGAAKENPAPPPSSRRVAGAAAEKAAAIKKSALAVETAAAEIAAAEAAAAETSSQSPRRHRQPEQREEQLWGNDELPVGAAAAMARVGEAEDVDAVALMLAGFAQRAAAVNRGDKELMWIGADGGGGGGGGDVAGGGRGAAAAAAGAGAGKRQAAAAPSKKPRLPTEMVQKIVDKAVEKQQARNGGGRPHRGDVDSANEEEVGQSAAAGAGAAAAAPSQAQAQARRTRAPEAAAPAAAAAVVPSDPSWGAPRRSAVDPGSAVSYEDFLKLQEQVNGGKKERGGGEGASAAAKKPKPSAGAANAKAAAAAAAAAAAVAGPVKKAADKAPKKPVAAGVAANARAESSGKPQGEGDKVLRQMFDKRESRRMNAKPFAAAVQRWRNRRVADGGHRDVRRPGRPRHERAGGVSVYVRKRPLFEHEQKRGEFDVVTVPDPPAPLSPGDATEVVIHNCQMHADLKRMYAKHASFDVTRAFGEDAESEEVYEVAAAPMVAGALSGGVAALFMYGQTGSGKTHTMEAIEQSAIEALFAGAARDCLPRGLHGDGAGAEEAGEGEEVGDRGWVPGAVSVRVAYFEIAGKKCTDLLSPQRNEIALKEVGGGFVGAGAGRALEPHEYRQLDVQLLGAVEPVATSADELAAIVAAGKSRRATSATHCNAASSRSHAVLRLTCQLATGGGITDADGGSTGRLTLVDCAGSERKEDNMHHSVEQRKETAEINASLYALKECVRMRRMQHQRFGFNGEGGGGGGGGEGAGGGGGGGGGGGHVHVPYRSSHLTRVLMECFVRPDAQLGVIGTVSPASTDTEHSVSTLKTVGLIGGGEEGEGVSEEKEDVPRKLEVATDGSVSEARVERTVAPVRWSNAHIRAWMAKPGNEKFAARVAVPPSLQGRDIVRMSPSALQNLCGGDAKLAQALHNKLRDEIARCSARK